MLVQLPRGSGREPPGPTKDPFEAALRRDLANAPVVAYEAVIGGWEKRAFDIGIVVLTAPVWIPLTLVLAGVVNLMQRGGDVFVKEERIGYGGHSFECRRMRLSTTAVIERLPIAGDAPPAPTSSPRVEGRVAKWRRALERLPQLLNVLSGEMSIVGPRPLTRPEVEDLRTARRYYLSARPGVVGVGSGEGDESVGGPYKVYSLAWSLWHDIGILLAAERDLRNQGELWRPAWRLAKREAAEGAALARRRSS